jgi:hypothetical protein
MTQPNEDQRLAAISFLEKAASKFSPCPELKALEEIYDLFDDDMSDNETNFQRKISTILKKYQYNEI